MTTWSRNSGFIASGLQVTKFAIALQQHVRVFLGRKRTGLLRSYMCVPCLHHHKQGSHAEECSTGLLLLVYLGDDTGLGAARLCKAFDGEAAMWGLPADMQVLFLCSTIRGSGNVFGLSSHSGRSTVGCAAQGWYITVQTPVTASTDNKRFIGSVWETLWASLLHSK